MKNIETRKNRINEEGILPLLNKARMDERANQHFSVSIRLEALATYIQQNAMTSKEAVELIRKEAANFERSAQELR